jgi:hypothetical protein
MADRAAMLAEAYRRGLLTGDKKVKYEEAMRRGLVGDTQSRARAQAQGGLPFLSGLAATFNEAVPLADEAVAGVGALIDAARGKGSLSENWRRNRDVQLGLQEGARDANRTASDLATGLGYVAQAAPALASGGVTLAPQLAARGLPQVAKRVAVNTAKNATVGAGYAAGNAVASRGSLSQRAQAADAAILPGAVAGVVLPAIAATPGFVRRAARPITRAAARTANKALEARTGKGFLDPQVEAMQRVGAALRADRFSPEEITHIMGEWSAAGGPSPAFMDLISRGGRGQHTMALFRGAAMTGEGRNVATQYGNQVAADLQDNAIARTQQLTPDQRTIPQVQADIDRRIAVNSQAPQVHSGSGGARVSEALNTRFDEANARVNQAYGAAREAAPEGAHVQSSAFPELRANIRDAVRDFHPDDMPSVARELNGLDKLSAPTIRDLYEARQRLTSVRLSKPDQAAAAGRAISALDDEIANAVNSGVVTGDPNVVNLWRQAIGERRAMGRQFQGDDLIQSLTERDWRGGGKTNVIAPEDASNVILGRNGVSNRTNTLRDLTRLRDTLGERSPEWNALRQEAVGRLLGPDAGAENFGRSWMRFEQENPELARLLLSRSEREALAISPREIQGAQADRSAVEAGRGVLNTTPDRYAAGLPADRMGLAQLSAARALEDAIGRPSEGSTGVLNRISTATSPGRNLAATFGDDAAGSYQRSIGQMVDQLNNARYINPNTGSQTAGRLADESLMDLPTFSKAGIIQAIVRKLRAGVTLTDAERGVLVRLATSRLPELPPTVQAALAPRRALRLPQRVNAAAVAGGQSQGQRK